jgi:hypothetical protein
MMVTSSSVKATHADAEEPEVVRDLLVERLLPLEEGDRLWKLYIFSPAGGRATHLQHRIYSKVKPDGHLAIVTFAVHSPVEGQAARSAIARVPDLKADALEHIIETIRRETQVGPDEDLEIDVSHLKSVSEQLAYVRERLAGGRDV